MTDNNHQNIFEKKEQRLSQIKQTIQNMQSSPLYAYRVENGYKPVIGEGNPNARIMFVGEAPGEKEANSGQPFVGRAGQVLDDMIKDINLNREDVYITNIVKDRPPNNRDPKAAEIDFYAPFLMAQIKIISPEVIVTLGRFAMNFILKRFSLPEHGSTIGDLHGQILDAETEYGNFHILPLYHPAAIFYNRSLEEKVEQDFQMLSRFV